MIRMLKFIRVFHPAAYRAAMLEMIRNINKTIFEFNKGSIVHFALDYDNISMTTKLTNQDTVFRPFNKPDITDKKSYPTSFLWKEIWIQKGRGKLGSNKQGVVTVFNSSYFTG